MNGRNISIRFEASELETIKQKSEALGMDRSDFVRKAVKSYCGQKVEPVPSHVEKYYKKIVWSKLRNAITPEPATLKVLKRIFEAD